MKRREFIILTGVGATSAGVLSACGHPEEKLIPALIPDDEYVPGIDVWKASTCAMCDAGCGIVVRTRDHKANKIEGNPLHPVNRGALCARGQAGLQVLYNPDRIKSPLKRVGERFSGQFEEISWDEAIKTLTDKLREIKAQGVEKEIVFATKDSQGVTALAADIFAASYGGRITLAAESIAGKESLLAYEINYGRSVTPYYDIANATFLLSFGARFLETWQSPVRYSQAYGEFRRGKERTRGKFIHIEPRMSLTAANADEWLPAKSGTEGLIALAIAQVILRDQLIKTAVAPKFLKESLDEYALEKTADFTEIPAEKIIRIAREFAASPRPLAIGDTTTKDAIAINFLNVLVGNVNKKGGVVIPAFDSYNRLKDLYEKAQVKPLAWTQAATSLHRQNIAALLLHQINPAYLNPQHLDQIKSVPFIASFSSFMDETTMLADLVLPDHSYLESWDLQSLLDGGKLVVETISQPVVKPEFKTKQTADVLLALSRAFKEQKDSAFDSAESIVKYVLAHPNWRTKSVVPGYKKTVTTEETDESEGEKTTDKGDDHVLEILLKMGWTMDIKDELPEVPAALKSPSQQLSFLSNNNPPHSDEYPLTLLAYEHATLGYGEQANLPMLQEIPDTMTSVMWGSWLEINPKTAARLNITDGDLIEISSSHGSVRAPAVVYPAIHPDVVAMPYGQGHTAYGRFAKDKGANAITVNPYAANSDTSAVRVNLKKVSSDGKLIRFGTNLPEHIEIKR